jgi:hypothetical protein
MQHFLVIYNSTSAFPVAIKNTFKIKELKRMIQLVLEKTGV